MAAEPFVAVWLVRLQGERETLASAGALRYREGVHPAPLSPSFSPILLGSWLLLVAAMLWLGRRGARPKGWRLAAAVTSVVVLAITWFSPLDTLAAHYLLSAHLVQVLLISGLIPPLLLLGLPATRRRPHRSPRLIAVLVHPITALVAVNTVFLVWHLPGPYNAALASEPLYSLSQVTMLATSILFWWPIVVPAGRRRVMGPWPTLGYIVVATIPQTFAGVVVALARHPLYAVYAGAPRVTGASALTDQQVAGAGIAMVSKIALFTAFTIVFMHMLSEQDVSDSDDGGGGGRRPQSDAPSPTPSGLVPGPQRLAPWLADVVSGRTVHEPQPRVREQVAPGSDRR